MVHSILAASLLLSLSAQASNPIGVTSDGSLWDFIEAPTPPKDSDAHDAAMSRAATHELRSARVQESAYVDRVVRLSEPPIDFYSDPVAHLASDPLHLPQGHRNQ